MRNSWWLFFLLPLLAFSFCGREQPVLSNGRYIDERQLLSLDLLRVEDSIIGLQCFVTSTGNKVDCCLKEDGFSIKLSYTSGNTFEGTMTSCYDDQMRKVIVKAVSDSTLDFSFTDSFLHPFISREIRFFKDQTGPVSK